MIPSAGKIYPGGYYYDFQPDYTLRKDSVECFGLKDSLAVDVNGDSTKDLVVWFEEEVPLMQFLCCPPDLECFPLPRVSKFIRIIHPNLQISVDTITHLPLALEADDELTSGMEWSASGHKQYLFSYTYGYGDTSIYGAWSGGTHYAGIRLIETPDTLYGWIRMNTDSTVTLMDLWLESK